MTTTDFLRKKGMLQGIAIKFVITGDFGVVLLNDLLEEYAALAVDRCKEKAIYYEAAPPAIVDFIDNVKSEFV